MENIPDTQDPVRNALARGAMGYQAFKSAKSFVSSLSDEQKATGANALQLVHTLVRGRLPLEVNHLIEHFAAPLEESETAEERLAGMAMHPESIKLVTNVMRPVEETRPEKIANLIKDNGGLGVTCPSCNKSVVIQAPD